MNINLPTQFKKIHFSGKDFFPLWFRFARKFFVAFFFVVLCGGAYVWYENVYHGQWSDEEKQRYIETTFKETVFKKTEFLNAIGAVRKRADAHRTDMEVGKDIFEVFPWSVPQNN